MNIEELIAERQIYRKIVGFARAMDDRNWEALDEITRDDINFDLGAGMMQGRDALIENIRSFLDDCGPTQHLLGNVLIDVIDDKASSKAYVSDLHVSANEESDQTFSTLGDYHDEWQKMGNEWFMIKRVKQNHAFIGSWEVLGSGPDGWHL
tara:strand:- start:413 stop:865 length:453 start_codon:yes stop_codon:yes gene_type:complete